MLDSTIAKPTGEYIFIDRNNALLTSFQRNVSPRPVFVNKNLRDDLDSPMGLYPQPDGSTSTYMNVSISSQIMS